MTRRSVSHALTKVFAFRIELVIVVLAGFLALSAHIRTAPLIDWDEATYAEVAHEAVASGHYVNLTWNRAPYLKKPPLLFWMEAASLKMLGESEMAIRAPSVLMGLGTIILIYLIASDAFDRRAGFFAALVPLGFYFFVARGGREAATDAPLLFFSALSVFAMMRSRRARWWMLLAGGACGMAILSKGLAGTIPAIVAVIAIVWVPGLHEGGILSLVRFAAGAAAIGTPWYAYQALHNPAMFWSVFVGQETLARLTSHLEDERHTAAYTFSVLGEELRSFWPVLIPLPLAMLRWLREGVGAARRRISPGARLCAIWFAAAFAAAFAVQTRLPWYVLPSLVPAAVLIGCALSAALQNSGRFGSLQRALGVIAIVILAAIAPSRWADIEQTFETQRELSTPSYMMAVRARELAVQTGRGELYFAGEVPLPTLVYYSGLRCHFVAPIADGEIEQTANDTGVPALAPLDLMLVDVYGNEMMVSNYQSEWDIFAAKDLRPSGHVLKRIGERRPALSELFSGG